MTLTDLQEAEKTMKTDNKGREKKEEEKEAKLKKAEEGVRAICSSYIGLRSSHVTSLSRRIWCLQEVSWRSRIASLQKSDLLGLTQPTGSSRAQTADKKGARLCSPVLQSFFQGATTRSCV